MRNPIRIIALDLDGTLLNSRKKLSPGNLSALERAAAAGIEIVPTTGRFYGAMPEQIRMLPFIHYAISINGAQVSDLRSGKIIYKAELPWQQAVRIMELLDRYPVIYDCFQDNAAWMTGAQKQYIDQMISSPHYRKMFHELRRSVSELKAYLREKQCDVQKLQFFTNDPSLRLRLFKQLPQLFENVIVSSSVSDNVEVNQLHANKGEALWALSDYLHLPRNATLSFGDGLNDLTMLRDAGIGVAMENACDEVKAQADWITRSCDEDGVAYGIAKFCFEQ